AVVCTVTETRSASPRSTSGASATSASPNFLIDLSSLAQTAVTQKLNAMMKTPIRIRLAKFANINGQLYQNHRPFNAKDWVFLACCKCADRLVNSMTALGSGARVQQKRS